MLEHGKRKIKDIKFIDFVSGYDDVFIYNLREKVFCNIDLSVIDEFQYIEIEDNSISVLVYYDIFNNLLVSVSLD